MKILGKESLAVVLLNAAFLPINAQTSCVHESLQQQGFVEFSRMLTNRSIDFKYGEFTIFAPSDEMLRNGALILTNDGHTEKSINDILLFHVSAEKVDGNVTDPAHCGESLLMLNEELHVNQENSITDCIAGKVYQVGPGNIGTNPMPEVVGDPVFSCHSVIYTLQGSLMLPTLGNVTLTPTVAPAPTMAPNRQSDPTAPAVTPVAPTESPIETSPQPDSGGSMFFFSIKSVAFAASVGVIVGLL